MQQGLYPDLGIDQYHQGRGISKTGLDLVAKSPAHYYARYLDPQRPPEPSRAGQLEGSLAHCALLEPDEFFKRYASLPPDAPRRPTEAQWKAKNPSPESIASMAWWEKFNADHVGKQIITGEQATTAFRQAESVRKLPDVREILEVGAAEQSAYWIDPETGELCRCRPDWNRPCGESEVILLDLKTYSSACPAEFARQVARKRYHVQDGFYSDGYGTASKRTVLDFVFVAVETEWPYFACAMRLDPASREQGQRQYQRDLAIFARCKENNEWPPYSQEIETISLPAWAFDNDEELEISYV